MRYDFMGPHEIITRHTRPRTCGRRTAPLTTCVLQVYYNYVSLHTGQIEPLLTARGHTAVNFSVYKSQNPIVNVIPAMYKFYKAFPNKRDSQMREFESHCGASVSKAVWWAPSPPTGNELSLTCIWYGHGLQLLSSNFLRWLCAQWRVASVSSNVPLSAALLRGMKCRIEGGEVGFN